MPLVRSADRLRRILVLVPWVMANPGAPVDEVCARFSMTRAELSADLDLLFMCGLPPFGPGDLIEAYIDEDEVVIRFAEYLARPPRLTRAEAIGLLVMGRALSGVPGFEASASLQSALDKLADAAAPGDAGAADRVAVDLGGVDGEVLAAIRRAIDEHARVRIAYYSAGRDAMTDREVDPLVAFNHGGWWYVAAFDHDSTEDRVFRVDRIKELTPTGSTFDARKELPDTSAMFTPSPRDLNVVIEVDPHARWIREVIPLDDEEELADGRARLVVRTPHLAWLVRLLLSAGPAARALEPPELVDQVRDAAKRAVERY